jgi:hypothetical protein
MFVFTLVVIGLLCLMFKSTRLTGVVGLTLLSLVYPQLFLMFLLLIGSATTYFIYRRKDHAIIQRLSFRRR